MTFTDHVGVDAFTRLGPAKLDQIWKDTRASR
jgi:hypothetical protein